ASLAHLLLACQSHLLAPHPSKITTTPPRSAAYTLADYGYSCRSSALVNAMCSKNNFSLDTSPFIAAALNRFNNRDVTNLRGLGFLCLRSRGAINESLSHSRMSRNVYFPAWVCLRTGQCHHSRNCTRHFRSGG